MLLYKKGGREKKRRTEKSLRLSVKPVFRTVLDSKATLNALTCLGRRASSSVDPVNLLVRPLLVVADGSIELEPRDTAEFVFAEGSGLGRRAFCVDGALDTAVVGILRLEIEQRHAGSRKLVVARQAVVGLGRRGDGVVERERRHLSEHIGVEAGSITRSVEERGNCTRGLGDLHCRCRRARVVLGSTANGNVAEGKALSGATERCWC